MKLTYKGVKGFTLLELLVTFVIVSIITIIALPSLNSYITQGKVSDAIVASSELKNAITKNILQNATTKGSGTGVTLPKDMGRYVENFSLNNDGIINITTTENAGKINFTLVPVYDEMNKSVKWLCNVTSSSFNDFAPEQCRV